VNFTNVDGFAFHTFFFATTVQIKVCEPAFEVVPTLLHEPPGVAPNADCPLAKETKSSAETERTEKNLRIISPLALILGVDRHAIWFSF
jgi:hypothetical protein